MTCTNSPSSHGPTFPPGPPCTRLLLSAGGTPHTDHNGIRIYCSPSFIKRRHNGERDRGQFEAGLTLPNLASGASVPNYPSAARRDRSRVRWAPSLLPTPRPPSASRATGRTCRRRIAPSQGVKGREWKVGVGQSKRAVCKRSMGTGRAGSTLSALACGMEATGEQAQLFPRMVGAGAPGVVAQHEQ